MKNKILIFGGAGSLGTQLVEYYLNQYGPEGCELIIVSRDEGKHWLLKNKFQNNKCIKTIICDVQNYQRVYEILLSEKPKVIIMAQALKQVDTCEKYPQESIGTNINGTINILNTIHNLFLSNIHSPKTVCFVSTDKACLDYHSPVLLANGKTMRISDIVKNKEQVVVKSYNYKTDKIEENKVIGWFKNKLSNRDMYCISYKNAPHHMKHHPTAYVTSNHPILTERGWVEASQLNDSDILITAERAPNFKQMSLLCGTILGDSSIIHNKYSDRISFGQCKNNETWVEIIKNSLNGLKINNCREYSKKSVQNFVNFHLCGGWVKPYLSNFYDAVKVIPKQLIKKFFNPILMAAWFMDDACLSYSNTRLATHSFSKEDVEWLIQFLNSKGFECYIYGCKYKEKIYYETRFTVKGTKTLHKYIHEYILPCFQHKLLPEYKNKYNEKLWNLGESESFKDKIVIQQKKYKQKRDVYCLEVENNNNFIVHNVIVHNCNPINVYGMCKSISEKLTFNAAENLEKSKIKFITIRYGNVANSKGSILPLLLSQAKDNNIDKFTLTHCDMTRFIMSLEQAVKLIDTAITYGQNGELWVPKLPSLKIIDVMKFFSNKYNKPYEITGIRPGEKIHEVMLSLEEAIKVQIKHGYFIVDKSNVLYNNLNKEYSSADFVMTSEEINTFLDNFLNTL